MPDQLEPITKRYDFVLLFDVIDGNPNGDPDAGNLPRTDPQTLQGIVTDVCLKRKIRNAVSMIGEDKPGNEIYFQTQDAMYEKRILNLQHQRAYDALGIDLASVETKKKNDKVGEARQWMCQNFYDIRTFGAVMTTGVNCGQVRGPVQLTFARSIDSILPLEYSITRKSVTSKKEADKQIDKEDAETKKKFGSITGTMGRKNTVPYGLYRCSGFINPFLAKDTGFHQGDLELLWKALTGLMWEFDRSASRGLMATRGLYVFEHDSKLGNAPAHELFELIKVPKLGDDQAPRSFDEYKVEVPKVSDVPNGVTLHQMVPRTGE